MTDTATASTTTPGTPSVSFSMPLTLADLSDTAVARYEAWFRAERIRRARLAAKLAPPPVDPDDAIVEALKGNQIDAVLHSLGYERIGDAALAQQIGDSWAAASQGAA